MVRFRYKKLAIFTLLNIIIFVMWGDVCYADSFKDLRAVKLETWKKCEWNKWGVPVDYKKILQGVDGAVNEDGMVYMSVNDWADKGIPKTGEVPIFGSETSSAVIGILKEDSVVQVLEQGGKRTLIQSGCIAGYVDSGKLLYREEAESRADEVCPEGVLTDMNNVGVYRSPQKTETLCYLQQRQYYDIIEKIPGWYRIAMDYFGETYVEGFDVKLVRKVHFATSDDNRNAGSSYREVNLSDTDRQLLAAITWCEAGSDSFDGQVAVASAVLNRVESDLFPNTIEEVIRQKGQFVPTEGGWYDEVLAEPEKIKDSCFEAVDYVLQGNRTVDTYYFNQAGRGKKIGSHWFY